MKTPMHRVKTLARRVRDKQPYWQVRRLFNWRGTGVKDKNGREIFEGDKLQFSGSTIRAGKIYTIVFTEGCFRINDAEDGTPLYRFEQNCMEVVGHIAEVKNHVEN